MKNILKTYALHKKFGLHSALKDLNITIPKSSVYAILGPNGSGKSSLFKLLLGEVTPDSGNFAIPSQWCIAHMAQELATSERSALDFVLDGDPLLREVEANVEAALAANDNNRLANAYEKMDTINGFDAHYRAEQLLHGLGFYQSEISRPVNSFSGGWRIRLNLAQAFLKIRNYFYLMSRPITWTWIQPYGLKAG